jgi:hypothetical protein
VLDILASELELLGKALGSSGVVALAEAEPAAYIDQMLGCSFSAIGTDLLA